MERDNSYLIGNQFAKGSKSKRTSFKKGHIPWNKGIKGTHFSPETEFKKGGYPPTYCKVGTIRKRKHWREKTIHYWIKIADPKKWIFLSHYRWIQEYGPLIKGDIVHHINGLAFDDRINNLIALPRKDKNKFYNRSGLKPMPEEVRAKYLERYVDAWLDIKFKKQKEICYEAGQIKKPFTEMLNIKKIDSQTDRQTEREVK